MKTSIICVALFTVLLGCSKQQLPDNPKSTAASSAPGTTANSSLPQITFIESQETGERKQIKAQALTLFTNRDYSGLEALAANYRVSKEQYANGFWKLVWVYGGVEPLDEAADAVWQARIKQVQDWVKASPKAVMPRITLARLMTSYAWKARGAGWADNVKERDWKPFFNRLQQAQTYLKQAKQLEEKCPVYWSTQQRIALGLQYEKPQYNAVFAEAIGQFRDYQYYYSARATYLLPRWYGEEGEWENDLAKSADRLGGEAGDVLYAQVIWEMNHYGSSGMAAEVFKGQPSRWERVDRGFGVILQKYPDSLAAKTERSFLAALAGDKAKARQYFMETKGNVDLAQWPDKETFEDFLKWTFSP